MTEPTLQVSQLEQARQTFSEVLLHDVPKAALADSRILLQVITTLIDRFYISAQALFKTQSKGGVSAVKTKLKNDVDLYLLDIKERLKQLEARVGDLNLDYYTDVLETVLDGELTRLATEARTRLDG